MAIVQSSKDNASLGDFLQILRLRKALIGLLLALIVVTALAVTAFLPKWYVATTKVRVEKPEGEVKLFQAQSSGLFDPQCIRPGSADGVGHRE
jgi:succinoglycan biosynthesis transport protein ExoP